MEGIAKYFPRELCGDPDRIDVLYAPFRDKNVNPIGYESKLKTWQDAITRYMRVNKTALIELEELTRAFSFNDKAPRCLNQVVVESVGSKKLIGELEYRNSLLADQRGWIPWAVGLGFDYLLKKPVSMTVNWAVSSLVGNASNHVEGGFVSREMIEELSASLYQFCNESAFREKLTKNRDGIGASLSSVSSVEDAVEYEVLRRETTSIVGDEETLSILLTHLRAKGKVRMSKLSVGEKREEKTYLYFEGVQQSRFPPSASTLFATPSKNDVKSKELTEKEKTLLQLEATANELIRQIEAIHAEETELQQIAKGYLAKGMKTLALSALKRKKMLRGKLESREKSLENIEVMMSKLRDVDSNKMVFAAYKDAVVALNKSLSETDVDAIEDTMEDMREVLDKQAEMEEALSGKGLREDEDEDELELELEQILNESDHETEDVGLPEVPTQNVEDLLDKLCISPLKVETSEKPAVRPQMAML